jgi:pimeloyl-ACP methyl ester carboxylesterase
LLRNTVFFLALSACGFGHRDDDTGINSQLFQLYEAEVVPKIFVHGGGPRLVVAMDSAANWYREDGYYRSDLHQIYYSWRESLEAIRSEVQPQIDRILARYPESTRFDVIGHSLGHSVALDMILTGGIAGRVRTLVGLAGVAMGQNKSPRCLTPRCPQLYSLLIPVGNSYIRDLLANHAEEYDRMKKCALFSESDRILEPVDSGARLPGSISAMIPNVGHLEFKKSRAVYRAIQEVCSAR